MEKASEHSTKTVKNFIFFDNIFECLYLYHITGLVLALLLVTGSSTKPADYRNIGYRYNLPVIKRRLQRDFNRAVLETKIGFYTTVTRDIMARGKTYSDSSNWTEIRFFFLEILEGLHVL